MVRNMESMPYRPIVREEGYKLNTPSPTLLNKTEFPSIPIERLSRKQGQYINDLRIPRVLIDNNSALKLTGKDLA